MTAVDVHDLERYRNGCRCDVCRAANRDYMRAYRASRRGLTAPAPLRDDGLEAPATVLMQPAVVDAVRPGAVEQGVIDRCMTGDLVSSALRMPDLAASCRALARILDDPRQVTTQPSAHRQLMAGIGKLEEASMLYRRGRLASVAALSRRGSSWG
jgi:hypothetical protein